MNPEGALKLKIIAEFIKRHKIEEIQLDQKETREFFKDEEEHNNMVKSKIFLSTGLAEVVTQNDKKFIFQEHRVVEKNLGNTDHKLQNLLHKLEMKFGLDWIISSLANYLSNKFAVSYGQMSSVIKRELGITLNSGERTHIYELKRKIDKYRPVVEHFEYYIDKNIKEGYARMIENLPENTKMKLKEKDRTRSPEGFVDQIQRVKAGLKEVNPDMKKSKPPSEFYNKLQELKVQSEILDEKLRVKEATIPKKVVLKCAECGQIESIPPEQLRSKGRIEIKKHCELDMRIVITDQNQTEFARD